MRGEERRRGRRVVALNEFGGARGRRRNVQCVWIEKSCNLFDTNGGWWESDGRVMIVRGSLTVLVPTR